MADCFGIRSSAAGDSAGRGRKSGTNEKQFYRDLIRVADERFAAHLKTLAPKRGGKSRADLLLSTLGSYVAAMGGKPRLIAEFPNRQPVTIALADITGDDPVMTGGRRWGGRR
jgi:hypothetical protein